MKSVAVIGQGFVGGSLTTVLSERGLKVYTFDITGRQATGGTHPKEKIVQSPVVMGPGPALYWNEPIPAATLTEFVQLCVASSSFSGIFFVCLPTPMYEGGAADVSIVEETLKSLASIPSPASLRRIAVIKSTVPPGSTERWNSLFEFTKLRVVFNPEFLREATALDDMRNQSRIILGGPRPYINKVKQLFEGAFPNVPVIKTSSTTAEMVKYVTNVHLAVKVALANEFYQICENLDAAGANIDYDKVVEYALHDQRLGSSHWKVPGPMPADDSGDPAFGFGGSCFVKDINALMHVARKLGIDPKVMSGAWEKNLEVRPQRDWERLVGRAISKKP